MAVNFDPKKIRDRLDQAIKDRNIEFGVYVIQEVERGGYVPRRSGALESSRVIKTDKKGNSIVSWEMPYARRMFYGSRDWKWTKVFNKRAQPFWTRPIFTNRTKIDEILRSIYGKRR